MQETTICFLENSTETFPVYDWRKGVQNIIPWVDNGVAIVPSKKLERLRWVAFVP